MMQVPPRNHHVRISLRDLRASDKGGGLRVCSVRSRVHSPRGRANLSAALRADSSPTFCKNLKGWATQNGVRLLGCATRQTEHEKRLGCPRIPWNSRFSADPSARRFARRSICLTGTVRRSPAAVNHCPRLLSPARCRSEAALKCARRAQSSCCRSLQRCPHSGRRSRP